MVKMLGSLISCSLPDLSLRGAKYNNVWKDSLRFFRETVFNCCTLKDVKATRPKVAKRSMPGAVKGPIRNDQALFPEYLETGAVRGLVGA